MHTWRHSTKICILANLNITHRSPCFILVILYFSFPFLYWWSGKWIYIFWLTCHHQCVTHASQFETIIHISGHYGHFWNLLTICCRSNRRNIIDCVSATVCEASYCLLILMKWICRLRFFLGVFEAGIGPGVPLYLSFWYEREEMAKRVSLTWCTHRIALWCTDILRADQVSAYFSFSTIAGALGGFVAYATFTNLQNTLGLKSWQWLFIIEGAPTILMGLLSFFILPD